MDLEDNNVRHQESIECVRVYLFRLVDFLTTNEKVDDVQRVDILLTEIDALVEALQTHAYRVFEFTSNALAIRAKDEQCPDIELDRTVLLIRNTMERFPYPLGTGFISLGRLAIALHTRFWKSQNIDDIEESIDITRRICELCAVLVERLRAIRVLKRACEIMPESALYRLQCLNNLRIALMLVRHEFLRPEYLDDVIDAIRLMNIVKREDNRQYLNLSVVTSEISFSLNIDGAKDDAAILILLSNLLHTRFKVHGDRADWKKPLRSQLPLDIYHCIALERLALYLHSRIEYDKNPNDSNAAVEIHRKVLVLRLSESERHLPKCLSNLANALDERYTITGDKSSQDEAIAIFRDAETITPESHIARSYILHNLAIALRERYHATGIGLDLDESTLLLREVLRLRPAGHELRYATLHSLSISLKKKYENSTFNDFLSGYTRWSPNVFNLGATFREHFLVSEGKDYIDESIKCLEEALTLPAPPSSRVSMLHSLGSALCHRSISYFAEVEYFSRNFVKMKIESINMPASVLRTLNDQYEKLQELDSTSSLGDLEDINHAISCYEEAIQIGNFGAIQSSCLMAFADCLSLRFHHLWDIEDILRAAEIYRGLLRTVNIICYKIAIELLPQIAAMGLDIDSRRRALQEAMPKKYAMRSRMCTSAWKVPDAVEFLEHGRAIYWSQVLQLNSPMESLLEQAPELGNTLQSISNQLHLGSLRNSLPNDIYDTHQRRFYESNAKEWEKVLQEVRSLQGFEDFLLPKGFSTLQKFLKPDEKSALLISNNEVKHVPLLGVDGIMIAFLLPMIKKGRTSLPGYRHNSFLDMPDICPPVQISDEKSDTQEPLNDTSLRDALHWIWDAVAKPIIQALGIEKSNNPKRLLPLHAAGICEEDASSDEDQPLQNVRRSNAPDASIRSKTEFEMTVVLESRTLPWA
ncbi:hypothetical protein BDQ17DRAFT_1350785, partial [Cyathus striatus]